MTAFGSGIAFALGAVFGIVCSLLAYGFAGSKRRKEAMKYTEQTLRLMAERNKLSERIAEAIEKNGGPR